MRAGEVGMLRNSYSQNALKMVIWRLGCGGLRLDCWRARRGVQRLRMRWYGFRNWRAGWSCWVELRARNWESARGMLVGRFWLSFRYFRLRGLRLAIERLRLGKSEEMSSII